MSDTPTGGEIPQSARRVMRQAAIRGGYMASLLMIYQETERMDDEHVAAKIGVAVERLPLLALCREPRVDAMLFRRDIAEIAGYTGADALQLAMLVRAALGTQKMRSMGERTTGFLAAARDAEPDADEP